MSKKKAAEPKCFILVRTSKAGNVSYYTAVGKTRKERWTPGLLDNAQPQPLFVYDCGDGSDREAFEKMASKFISKTDTLSWLAVHVSILA